MAATNNENDPTTGSSKDDNDASSWSSLSFSSMDSLWESMVKVSLASFGGSLVGLALQHQEEELRRRGGRGTLGPGHLGREGSPLAARRLRAPPSPMSVAQNSWSGSVPRNLPGQWALSCLFFALVVETSRHLSPTLRLLNWGCGIGIVSASPGEGEEKSQGTTSATSSPILRLPPPPNLSSPWAVFASSCGDYALGGAVAGLAGARASHRRLGLGIGGGLSWGLLAGGSLGLLAGALQGGIDVAQLYLHEMQQAEGEGQPRSGGDGDQPTQSEECVDEAPSA